MEEQIETLKKLILDGEDFEDHLCKILEDAGPESIRPLLLMINFHKDDDLLHEMYTITHAIEDFPGEDYVREIVDVLGELSEWSPYFLNFLLLRIIRSDKDFEILRQHIATANFNNDITRYIIGCLEMAFDDPDEESNTKSKVQDLLRDLKDNQPK